MTPEQRDAFNAYQREYREKNKERVQAWRIQTYVHKLESLGYTVIPPQKDAQKDGKAE